MRRWRVDSATSDPRTLILIKDVRQLANATIQRCGHLSSVLWRVLLPAGVPRSLFIFIFSSMNMKNSTSCTLCLSVSTVQSTASLFVRFDSISVTSARRLLPVLLYCTCSQTTPACIEILHNHLNLIVTIVCSVCHIQRQGDDRFSIFISKGKNI